MKDDDERYEPDFPGDTGGMNDRDYKAMWIVMYIVIIAIALLVCLTD
jgi:hypothetical protein